MSDIQLVRQPSAHITDADKEAVRRVLFGVIDGLGDQAKKRWRRFWNGVLRMEAGEIVEIHTRKPRSGPFHRRHMAIETRVFEAQERIDSFNDFRMWLKVGAGFVTWRAGPRGGVFPIPRSIAFSELEEDEMREVHENMVAFLRTDHATHYLWPKLPAQQRDAAMEALLQEFDE